MLTVWDHRFGDNQEKGLMLVLSHPEKLRYLQCQAIGADSKKFANLKQVVSQHVKSNFSLSHNPKLKKLDLCFDPRTFYLDANNYYQEISRLMEQKKTFG